jgi:ATP-dependent protease ClpP protease subunit
MFFVMCEGGSAAWGSEKQTNIKLFSHNTIALQGEVDISSVSRLIDEISKNEQDVIYFIIDSGGGSIDDGLRLINVMKSSGKKFVCISLYSASMAFSILQACDVRYVTDSSILMQHIGSYQISGNTNKNQTVSSLIGRQFMDLQKRDSSRIGLKQSQFYKLILSDWWLYGKEAVKANVADAVVQVSCSVEIANRVVSYKYFLESGTATVTVSGCPMSSTIFDIKIESNGSSTEDDVYKEFSGKLFPKKANTPKQPNKNPRDSPR